MDEAEKKDLMTTIREEREHKILVIEHLGSLTWLSFKLFDEGDDSHNEDFKNMTQCILN